MRFVPLEKKHWDWMNERNKVALTDNTKGLAAESDSGDILGVCICDSWTHTSVQLHIAIDRPICLKGGRFLREVFGYVFNQAGRKIAYGLVPSTNEKALNFDRRIGFTDLITLKDAWADGVDIVMLEMRKEDCRWIDHEDSRRECTPDIRRRSAA